MFWRSLVASWFQNVAKAKLRDAVAQAVRGQSTQAAALPPAEAPKPCHLGVVFALGIESGCFEDVLYGIVTIRGNEFVVREGGLKGRRVAMILAGPGQENAARATKILIDGHRPQCVISAGFAGGLSPQLKRNDILVVERLVNIEGSEILIPSPDRWTKAIQPPDVHRGTLLTNNRVVRSPHERQSLHQQYNAMAVDMETFAVAEVCRRRQVPFSAIRVINDTADEVLSKDVEYLLTRKPGAAQWGAALGTVCRRPASAKDMYQLHENALVASGRLAKFLAETGFD
jgi:adenosylhomocysteine nucleosidase